MVLAASKARTPRVSGGEGSSRMKRQQRLAAPGQGAMLVERHQPPLSLGDVVILIYGFNIFTTNACDLNFDRSFH